MAKAHVKRVFFSQKPVLLLLVLLLIITMTITVTVTSTITISHITITNRHVTIVVHTTINISKFVVYVFAGICLLLLSVPLEV